MSRYTEMLWLRRASQINDRQVFPIPIIAHIKANGSATVAEDRCLRRCTSCGSRPPCPRLESRTFTCWRHLVIDLMRRLDIQCRVRSILIEPVGIPPKLPAARLAAKWYESDPRTFVLEAQNEPLHHGNATVLTNGAEAWRDSLAITPILEHAAPELRALVADDVFRLGPGGVNGSFEEVGNRYGCGPLPRCRTASSTLSKRCR